MQAVFTPFSRYADFSGRSRRMEYWLFTLMHTLVSAVLLAGFIGSYMANRGFAGMSDGALNFLTLFIFWIVATIIPGLALTVRRLHDINLSGWFWLLNFIPYIGAFVVLIMMFIDGTKGPNNYGADPKDRGDYWWEGDDGPPEGYRAPARTTGNGGNAGAEPVGGFGRRAQGFGRAATSSSDIGAMDRDEWTKRLGGGA